MKNYCFGVDVGGTTVKFGLFSLEGELLDKWAIATNTESEGKAIIPDIAASINVKLIEREIERENVLGVGIGVPAPVDQDGVVQRTVNLGWGYTEVKRELEELTHFPILVENDANIAALGEMWKGGGRGFQNQVLVTVGTGIGGGIIIDGTIFSGPHGAAGEIGHMCVNRDETERCGCGNKGCLEQYASATGIVRLAKSIQKKYPHERWLDADDITAEDVFNAVKEENEAAKEIAKEFGQYFGTALASVAALLDPEAFVIGGGVSGAGEVLLDYIEDPYKAHAFHTNQNVVFKLATLGNDAGIYGAAKMVLDGRL